MNIFTKIFNMNLNNFTVNATLLCFLSFIFPMMASAANWEVDPIRIDLSQKKHTNVLTIKNTSDSATLIQMQVFSWSQNGDQDNLEPTRDLIVSPPFVSIPPQSEQIIRIRLRRTADQTNELSYRINLVEIRGEVQQNLTGLNVVMQVGLPVFVEPISGKDGIKLSWILEKKPDNQIKVTLINHGKIHIKIIDFLLSLKDEKEPLANEPISSYVMAGQSRSWIIKQNFDRHITSEKINIKAFTDRGILETSSSFVSN